FGTAVHWDGKVLSDATLDTTKQPALAVEYRAATSVTTAAGALVGAAVASSAANSGAPQPGVAAGGPPAELFSSAGRSWSASSYTPPPSARPGDPYRTDLAAVALNADGSGWIVGNPAGWKLAAPNTSPASGGRGVADKAEPAPVVPIGSNGANPA